MLRKLDPIAIDPNEPFKNDMLGRKVSAENLTLLLQSLNQPFVMSLNGSWGTGKTTFVKMWKGLLEQKGHICFYFNAWQNDFADDPLVALIGEIKNAIDNRSVDAADSSSKITKLSNAKEVGSKIVKAVSPLLLRVLTQGLLDHQAIKDFLPGKDSTEAVAEFVEEHSRKRIEAYQEAQKSLMNFRKHLSRFADEVTGNGSVTSPIVFFVDELDRCRPSFAIALLERIKHCFDVPGFAFVLSVDREQLSHTIRAQYGAGIDANGYLRRFLDFEWALPSKPNPGFVGSLIQRIGLQGLLESREREISVTAIERVFTEWVDRFEISPRVQEQCMGQVYLAVAITPPGFRLFEEGLVSLVMLRAVNTQLYVSYRFGRIGAASILAELDKLRRTEAQDKSDRFRVSLEYFLTIWSNKANEFEDAQKKWLYAERDEQIDDATRQKYRHFRARFERDGFGNGRNAFDYVLNKLEFFDKIKTSK